MREEPSWHGADPDAPDFRDRVHERYAHVLEVAPVHRTPRGEWRLARHADVERLLRKVRTGVRTMAGVLPHVDESLIPHLFMLEQDPPNHGRLRRLVAHGFTPRAMDALHDRVVAIAAELVAAMQARGRVDIVADLALPLPTAVICEMMGVPVEDRDRFTAWTGDMTYILMGQEASQEQQGRALAAFVAMQGYVGERIEERRGSDADDLISVLVRAEEAGDRLSHPELLWQCVGLILAGFETTTGLIANGMRQLLLHPEQRDRLVAEPTRIDTAVDECLRFDPPILGTPRFLHEEARFGDHVLPPDTRVFAMLAAANRDPAVFEDPHRFDIGRDPNPHFGFGGGPHTCLGAFLAKLEARVAIGTLLQAMPRLELEDDEVTWAASLFRIPATLMASEPAQAGGAGR